MTLTHKDNAKQDRHGRAEVDHKGLGHRRQRAEGAVRHQEDIGVLGGHMAEHAAAHAVTVYEHVLRRGVLENGRWRTLHRRNWTKFMWGFSYHVGLEELNGGNGVVDQVFGHKRPSEVG